MFITSQPMSINFRCYGSNGYYKKNISQRTYISFLSEVFYSSSQLVSPHFSLFFCFFWRFCQMNFYFRITSRGLVTEALSWPDKPSPRRRPWRRWWPEVWRRRWWTSASSPSASTLAGRYPHQSSWFRLDQSINQSSINQSSNQAINQSIIILKGISLFTGNKWELEG